MRSLPHVLAWSLLLTLPLGCGDGSAPAPAQPPTRPSSPPSATGSADSAGKTTPWDAAAGTATIRGVVRFDGDPEQGPVISMNSDDACAAAHPGEVRAQPVALNADGTIRDVFVWIRRGLEGWSFPEPDTPALIDQKGCMYAPHVQGVRVGQPFTIRNSDPTTHNIHSLPRRNQVFNLAQPPNGDATTKSFTKPEVMVKLKCDIHSWMSAYVGVVDHPFFAVTGDGGTFDLGMLPPGEYTISAWQETHGTLKQTVTVADGEDSDIVFTFKP